MFPRGVSKGHMFHINGNGKFYPFTFDGKKWLFTGFLVETPKDILLDIGGVLLEDPSRGAAVAQFIANYTKTVNSYGTRLIGDKGPVFIVGIEVEASELDISVSTVCAKTGRFEVLPYGGFSCLLVQNQRNTATTREET